MAGLRLNAGVYNNENILYESLIIEAVEMHSVDFYYIPRIFVAKDEILGEDRLSKFKDSYPIPMYMESQDGFEGQGAFLSKFGIQMEQSAHLMVARRSWEQAVGRFGKTVLPHRPAEGDLLYFPMSGGLFEIMFVQHQNPFYQLGQLYTYKLTVELFRYSSETLSTGIKEVDEFNKLGFKGMPGVATPEIPDLTTVPTDEQLSYGDNAKMKDKKDAFFFDKNNPFGAL